MPRSTDDLTPSRRVRIRAGDVRRLYVLQHPWAMSSETTAAVAGVVLLLFPALMDDTTLGVAFPDAIEVAWLLAFAGGGLLALAGVMFLSSSLEVGGLVLLAVAYAVWAIAFPVVRGSGGLLACMLLTGMASGAGLRALLILTRPEIQPWKQRDSQL